MKELRDERGAVVPVVVFGTCCLLAVSVLVAVLGGALVAHRTAAAAADLAALAAATAVQHQQPGCWAAAHVARRNGAELSSCAVRGPFVVVQVATRVPGLPADALVARAEARAGPSSP